MTGSELKSFRKSLGLSQTEFAKKLNVTQNSVSFWEREFRHISASREMLIRLVFGLPLKNYAPPADNLTPDLFPDASAADGGNKAH